MHNESRFISNHHTMHEPYVPERRAHLRETTNPHDIAEDAPATSKDEPKKRGLLRLIEAFTGRSADAD
jgi:hypothetical protein